MTINLKTLSGLEKYLPIIQLRAKIKEAVSDMSAKVKIDEEHNYTRVSDGKWLAGVTSVSSLVPKEWLSAWGAKEAVKALGYSDYEGDTILAEEMKAKIIECKTIEEYLAILKEAKGASFRKSKDALIDGKVGHDWIENYIKTKMLLGKLPVMPKDMLERPLKQFVDWEKTNVSVWLLSEALVCDVAKEYAGTMDALAIMKDDSVALVDFKFASHISSEYHLQTSGYQSCLENYGIKIAKRIIVRLPKTLTMDEWDKTKRVYKKVENTIEVFEVDTPYEWDRDVFYSALPVKKWINANNK